LIGTTDVPVTSPDEGWSITPEEIDYLLAAVNRYLAKPLSKADVVSSYAAIRPLYDDGSANPSQVTRDYVFKTDDDAGKAPLLSVFGGKITTYRCLAEEALEKFRTYFPELKGAWTETEPLPGGNVRHFNSFRDEMRAHYGILGRDFVEGMVRRHGSRTPEILGTATKLEELGRHFGAGLTEREIEYFRKEEWARTSTDVLARRTKCGLHMDDAQRRAVAAYFGE
jgi:glycerol-3-phosphate dehydrogenase